jgi:phosphatidylserine/phosphatidylglycerophosphate/cardiolipin synthase-like enzyme
MRRRFDPGAGRGGLAPALVAGVLTIGCTHAHPARVLPPNAVQPPGASFAGEPHVGPAQDLNVVEDVVVATIRQAAHAPLMSALHLVGRASERLAVRVVELGHLRRHAGEPRDRSGDLGGCYGGPSRAARLTPLPSSRAAVDSLLTLIAGAQIRIDLMIYGWQDDPTGRLVADALAERARSGVRVRLLVDKAAHVIHNPAAARGEPTFLDALACVPNVTLVFAPDACGRFDHRKLAVIDDRVAWSGSMILTDVALRRWRNYSYLAEGPIVADFAAVFASRWRDVGQPAEPPLIRPGSLDVPEDPDLRVRLIETDVGGERSLKSTIYHAVDNATDHIYLSNPYFSDEILVAKLIAARARGVDVRVVLTLRGNIERMNRFSALNANRLFRGGCRVYLYPAMTHVKAMSADGTWAYLGTGNFDELSLRNNREVGLSISGAGAVRQVDETLFLPDMAASEELHALLPAPKGRLALEALSLFY